MVRLGTPTFGYHGNIVRRKSLSIERAGWCSSYADMVICFGDWHFEAAGGGSSISRMGRAGLCDGRKVYLRCDEVRMVVATKRGRVQTYMYLAAIDWVWLSDGGDRRVEAQRKLGRGTLTGSLYSCSCRAMDVIDS